MESRNLSLLLIYIIKCIHPYISFTIHTACVTTTPGEWTKKIKNKLYIRTCTNRFLYLFSWFMFFKHFILLFLYSSVRVYWLLLTAIQIANLHLPGLDFFIMILFASRILNLCKYVSWIMQFSYVFTQFFYLFYS